MLAEKGLPKQSYWVTFQIFCVKT